MTLPTDSKVRKEMPVYSGVLKYFPDAIAALARHSWVNNEKHNPGEPLHWSREKSSDHADCIARHLIDYAQSESSLDRRIEEMTAIMWRAGAQLQLDLEAKQAAEDRAQRIKDGELGVPQRAPYANLDTPIDECQCRVCTAISDAELVSRE